MNHLSNGFSNIEKKMMEEIKQRPLINLKKKEKEKLKFIKYGKDAKKKKYIKQLNLKTEDHTTSIYLQRNFCKVDSFFEKQPSYSFQAVTK